MQLNSQSPLSGKLVVWRAFVFQFLRDLVDAVRGKSHDYTSGSISRAITLLAIPMVLEMIMESVFTLVDVFFVSRLGAEQVAVVGITESMMTLVYAVAIGLSMAAAAMVSRRVGEKNPEQARSAALQSVYLAIAVSVPFFLVGFFFPHRILQIMGATPEMIALGSNYMRIMISGNLVVILLFVHNAVFRGAGDAALAMRALWLANGLNIILDPCLIFGLGPFPEWGLTGAAVATTTGRGIGVLFQLAVLFRGRGVIHFSLQDLAPQWNLMRRLFSLSLGGIFQWLIATSSWIALVRIVAEFGDEAVAGYTIGIRLIVFAILPAWGLSNAAATLVGQNLGARQPDRAERSVWLSAVYNMVFLGSVGVLFIIFAGPLLDFFEPTAAVRKHGTDCLTIISYANIMLALGLVVVQSFNGAGDTRTPTAVNLICYWVIQIPVAWLLAVGLDLGPQGVFIAVAIAESALAILGAYIFRIGRWKTREI
ncbi:MATE family efflux transporter [Sulfidibacter corallicola]|uniref:Multidrug-efflux transporter n=1 Tax=Sulfidibacter corallicola TaxID=2818388 RepID=A0A8A4TTN7_SULCO|nr:MATE family efflux transporter [Sulfidibacter corallicola]QTD52441.1 MATE family efflux transporter [Sulfidibacter corallicola]